MPLHGMQVIEERDVGRNRTMFIQSHNNDKG